MARGVFWGMELSHAPLRSESENFTLDAWLSHKKFRKWWLIYQKNKYCPPPSPTISKYAPVHGYFCIVELHH